jgi:phosphatidylserine decarboxylase
MTSSLQRELQIKEERWHLAGNHGTTGRRDLMKISKILVGILCCILFSSFSFSVAYAEQDTSPVKRLRELYAADSDFHRVVDLAFTHLKDRPDGRPNPWRGKNFDDLCDFFNDWFYFLPDSTNGLEYIEEFTWFYYKNPYGLRTVREEPGLGWTKYFVEERAKYMDSRDSARIVLKWMMDLSTHMDQFVVPEGGFSSFNQFFVREIKPGARPIDAVTDDSVIVSPADCVLNMINSDLTADSGIPLKGRMKLNIRELLNSSRYVDRFIGGSAVSCILLPTTYHHFHAPVSGMVVESRENVKDLYFGIEDFPSFFNGGNVGYNADYSIFERFHHGYFIIRTAKYGSVAMVPVGLNTISSIVFNRNYRDVDSEMPVPVYKGKELGHFAYGGSLVILLFEKDRIPSVKVLQGQQIGIFK